MVSIRRAISVALAAGVPGLLVAGCGSASHGTSAGVARSTTLPSGQVIVNAADETDRAPGYRLTANLTFDAGGVTVNGSMAGTVTDHGHRGALSLREQVEGHTVALQFRTAGETFYMTGAPGLSSLSHGRRWLRIDFAALERDEGLGGLQTETSSDPTRYLSYLRGVSGRVSDVGGATIRGAATTHYRANIDLGQFVAHLPRAQRPAARRSVATLERDLGGDTLPTDVWIDHQHRVRQMQLRIPICAAGHRISMALTMDLFDYGQVPAVTLPPPGETYDATSELAGLSRAGAQAGAACPAATS